MAKEKVRIVICNKAGDCKESDCPHSRPHIAVRYREWLIIKSCMEWSMCDYRKIKTRCTKVKEA